MDCSRARTRDPNEWLAIAPEFSGPPAGWLREWILDWQPDLAEAIRWNMLCFSARRLVCGISACRRHLGLTFFRGGELPDPAGLFNQRGREGGILSIRLTTLDGLDRPALRALLAEAVALGADPVPPLPKPRSEPWPMPDFFRTALAEPRHRAAAAGFARLAPTYQREHLVWLGTAKRPETRVRRLRETLAALATGRKWIQRKSAPSARLPAR